MRIDREFEQIASLFVEGKLSLDAYHIWLAEHAQDIADSANPFVHHLDGRSWLLLSEYQSGDLPEDKVRRELAEFLEENGRSSAPSNVGTSSR